jgi:diguanylate cyclase (GGDEF)-like protein
MESTTKILVAEDEPTSRHTLSAALAKLGYEIEIAGDGRAAWEALQRTDAPEIAILDWMMPDATGPEICRRLRARESGPYVYVILLTMMTERSALVEGLDSGADDFISKPFRLPELYARLRAGQRVIDLQRELLAGRAQMEKVAAYDFLTGLLNRRSILEKLGHEIARAERESAPLGVIMMDLDHFKRINDSYGHMQGDQVLQEAARRLSETVRCYDSIGRYGGEEFLLVAAGADLDATAGIAERLRRAIADEPMQVGDGQLQVTGSFGASAAFAGAPGGAKQLIEAADRALYRAKNAGRNRVELDGQAADGSTIKEFATESASKS